MIVLLLFRLKNLFLFMV